MTCHRVLIVSCGTSWDQVDFPWNTVYIRGFTWNHKGEFQVAERKSNVTIYLPAAVLDELRRLADAEGRSLSNYLSQFLGRHALQKANVKSFVADSRQMDISEAIAKQVEKGPVVAPVVKRAAKHK